MVCIEYGNNSNRKCCLLNSDKEGDLAKKQSRDVAKEIDTLKKSIGPDDLEYSSASLT
jgi:hypothetical protein